MKLYYSPGACSIGIHFLLEEIGTPFETQKVDLGAGEQFEPWYRAINPKSKVPALQRDDGSVLTEFPVIAHFLWNGRAGPHRGQDGAPVPSMSDEAVLAELEIVEHAVSTIHMQGFTRIFRPERFCPDEASHGIVKGRGVEIVKAGLEILAPAVEKLPSLSTGISMADAALFYVLLWGIDRVKLEVPDPLASRYRSLKMRPSATRVFAREGISLPTH
jgi:glutathione S-transferase